MKPRDCEQRQPQQCLGALSSLHHWNALPGCRKEARALRSVEVQGVLWLLRDELPEDLRPGPKLVSPSVPEDEEHLP